MLLDRDGRSVWVGYKTRHFQSGGMVHFDGDTVKKRITGYIGPESDGMTAIARDSSENLWFASGDFWSGGIYVLRDTTLTKYLKDGDGKVFGRCNTLFVDREGMVWTHADSGIARFDGSSWKLFDSAAVSPDLFFVRYSTIIQDKSGMVWFGTEGSGLIAYKDNRWYQFTTRDGIPNNSIRSLALDNKDNLWILTDNGIAMRKSGGMVHNQVRRDFMNPGNRREIKQRGSWFYVSSKDKPKMIRYTLFDLRGRVVHSQIINGSESFVIPESNFRFGSGLRILSITIEDKDESRKKYFIKGVILNK
jgi:streptogramin lyase